MSLIRARLSTAGAPSTARALSTAFVLAGLAFTSVLASPVVAASSENAEAATRDELQGIITKQLAAFDREDAAAAESFASPQLRDRFPDPTGFLAMVKENYAPLVKPRSTHFDETSDSPHGPLQKMTVVANDGTVWTAVYAFERVGGDWRISGCGLMKQESQDI